mmetsp:Transcript_18422/g.58006  ORF Transcript_18422/g.58006 Transcript_18422/m.58006 type:complete len:271 (+) Transcript_18422:231-1043(+)
MGSRCWRSCRGRAPLPCCLQACFNLRARSASWVRRRSTSVCFDLSAGSLALVAVHWCSTSATSACLWSRSALRRSRCSSRSSMCSARLAFSWPRVTQRTRRASRRASRSWSRALVASVARAAAAWSLRWRSIFASSRRAEARETAPSSLTRRRASTRSTLRSADSISISRRETSASFSILLVSVSAMRDMSEALCCCMAAWVCPPSSSSSAARAAESSRLRRIAPRASRRSASSLASARRQRLAATSASRRPRNSPGAPRQAAAHSRLEA